MSNGRATTWRDDRVAFVRAVCSELPGEIYFDAAYATERAEAPPNDNVV